MNKSYTVLITCLASILTTVISAQTLKGLVIDTNNTPLPSAQVLLRHGEAIKAFALTGTNGTFTLDFHTVHLDSAMIEFRYFGYAAQKVLVSDIDLQERLQVVLKEEGVELKQVVVSAAALPQITKGDTLIYRTDAYRDGSEKKIEEVIAKLPGVEVDEDGNIKVKGEMLDRILVDGEDLFDNNYKLLSRNVPADFVNRIDVIDNYHHDVLVGDLSGQKEMILNLHLDPDKKRPLFGEFTGQLGMNRFHAANSNLFHLGKKVKTVNFSDYGTSGRPSSVGVDLLFRSQGLGERSPVEARGALQSAATRQHRLLHSSDYLDNETFGTAQTVLMPLGKKAKNRLIFNLSGENYQLEDERLRENIALARIDSFQQKNQYDYRTARFWFVNDFDLLLDTKSRVDFRVSMVGAKSSAGVSTLNELIGSDAPKEIGTDLNDRPLSLLTSIRYVRRLNGSTALRFSARLKKEDLNQLQLYRGAVYQQLPGVPNSLLIGQVFDQHLTEGNLDADLLQQVGKYKLNHTVGYRRNLINTKTDLFDANTTPSGVGKFNYLLQESYLNSDVYRKFGKLKVNAGATISLFNLAAEPLVNESKKDLRLFALQPTFSLEYALNRRTIIRLWAKSNREIPRADQLISTPYLASGSTLNVGLDTSFLMRVHSGGLTYSFNNVFDQYGFSLDLNYRYKPNGIRSTIATENFVIFEQLVPGFASGMTSASLSADKYFSDVRINLKANLRYSIITDQLDFGGNIVDSRTASTSLNLQASTKINEQLNYGLKVNYQEFGSAIAEESSRQLQVIGQQQIIYRPGKQTKINVKHNLYFPRLKNDTAPIHLLETEVNHEFPNLQLSIGGGIRNVLNVITIEERIISIYQRYTQSYRLRPRTMYVFFTKNF